VHSWPTPVNQNRVAIFMGRKLGELTTEKGPREVESSPILLSHTQSFHWRRQHTVLPKTVFNYVATFNPFEAAFAELLQKYDDIHRFSALADFFPGFWVDYLKPAGAIGRYFSDWVAVRTSRRRCELDYRDKRPCVGPCPTQRDLHSLSERLAGSRWVTSRTIGG